MHVNHSDLSFFILKQINSKKVLLLLNLQAALQTPLHQLSLTCPIICQVCSLTSGEVLGIG